MSAQVLIEPVITEIVIDKETTQVLIDPEPVSFAATFETTVVEISVEDQSELITTNPVTVLVENDEIQVNIYSDIAPGSGGGGGGGTSFLGTPDQIEDTDATYFYFGWTAVNAGWLVRRQVRATAAYLDATVSNNPGVLNLASAWSQKESLNYA